MADAVALGLAVGLGVAGGPVAVVLDVPAADDVEGVAVAAGVAAGVAVSVDEQADSGSAARPASTARRFTGSTGAMDGSASSDHIQA